MGVGAILAVASAVGLGIFAYLKLTEKKEPELKKGQVLILLGKFMTKEQMETLVRTGNLPTTRTEIDILRAMQDRVVWEPTEKAKAELQGCEKAVAQKLGISAVEMVNELIALKYQDEYSAWLNNLLAHGGAVDDIRCITKYVKIE